MTRKTIITFFFALAICISCGTATFAAQRTIYSGECNNGPSKTDSGGCGTACLPACDQFSDIDASFCRQEARDTIAWKKYSLTETEYSSDCNSCEDDIWGYPGECSLDAGICYSYSFTLVELSDTCSLADKYHPESDDPYHLYPGHCSCGSVGNSAYKTCCAAGADGALDTVSAECGSYCKKFELDNYPPSEGNCPNGALTVYGSMCPQPPRITLTSSCSDDGSALIKWATIGADSCMSSDFDTGGKTENQVGVRVSNTEKTYKITCKNDYAYYNTSTGRRTTDSIDSSATVKPTCNTSCPVPGACYQPNAGQSSCSGFDISDGLIDIKYTPVGDGKDCDGSTPTKDLCCDKTCGKCSSIPGKETTYVTWTDLGSDGDGISCNSDYDNERIESLNDPRCVPPSAYFCDSSCRGIPAGAICSGGVISGDPSVNGKPCYSGQTCDNACGQTFYSCGGGSCSSAEYANLAACEAIRGVGRCYVTLAACSAVCGGAGLRCPANDVTTTVNTPNPVCLPKQPGQITSTDIGWSGRANNNCASVIGGGSPDNENVTCRNLSPNWSVNGSGSGIVSGNYTASNISATQNFSLECYRDPYTCNWRSSNIDTEAQCVARDSTGFDCGNCKPGDSNNYCASCSLCDSVCVEYWSDDAHCISRACGSTHESCSTCCDADGKNCGDCNCSQVCNYDGECLAWSCKDFDYYSVKSSKTIPGGSPACATTDSKQVRFMQKPVVTEFRPTKPQILLNQLIDIIWNSIVPDSGVQTVFKCTPSVASGGDPDNWTGAINSLPTSGSTADTGDHPAPKRSTIYELICRNNDRALCGLSPDASCQCYNDSDKSDFEVKVFEPELQERSPSLRNLFTNMIGSIWEALRRPRI